MIERKFVAEKLKEFQIKQYIDQTLKNVGHSSTKLVKTPLGEKIIISASRPGLVVGKKGENIKKLTNTLKKKFNLENPQIEIAEVGEPNLDAQIVAERIASTMERFGIQKFKAIAHKTMQDVMNAGALGIEIRISGKVPSARAKSWRFYQGYLKKCGNVAMTQVKHATTFATLRPGTVGVQVSIMPPDVKLPDDIEVRTEALVPEPAKEAAPKKQRARRRQAGKAAPEAAPVAEKTEAAQ
jgi:small subunit ribosomal protein S3